jgi:hypothetical protein
MTHVNVGRGEAWGLVSYPWCAERSRTTATRLWRFALLLAYWQVGEVGGSGSLKRQVL